MGTGQSQSPVCGSRSLNKQNPKSLLNFRPSNQLKSLSENGRGQSGREEGRQEGKDKLSSFSVFPGTFVESSLQPTLQGHGIYYTRSRISPTSSVRKGTILNALQEGSRGLDYISKGLILSLHISAARLFSSHKANILPEQQRG